MIDLNKRSGLPLSFDPGQEQLVLGEGLTTEEGAPDVRRRQDMQEVLYDDQADELDKLYYMYRGVAMVEDQPAIKDSGLRYDVTAVRPGTISREFVKTAGHYHPKKEGTQLTWPEVYEVLHGRAHYLMQSAVPGHPDQLEQVFLLAAKPGDKVLIPPGFGHITINPGEEFLIMSNWVAEGFSSLYDPIRKMKGGAYFELDGGEAPEFVPNPNYKSLPPLKRCSVVPVEDLSLLTGLPFYSVFKENNSAFRFLTHPEEYTGVFEMYLEELVATCT